jgi:hypothetical protein
MYPNIPPTEIEQEAIGRAMTSLYSAYDEVMGINPDYVRHYKTGTYYSFSTPDTTTGEDYYFIAREPSYSTSDSPCWETAPKELVKVEPTQDPSLLARTITTYFEEEGAIYTRTYTYKGNSFGEPTDRLRLRPYEIDTLKESVLKGTPFNKQEVEEQREEIDRRLEQQKRQFVRDALLSRPSEVLIEPVVDKIKVGGVISSIFRRRRQRSAS